MKILITNVYSFDNKGDAAIVLTMIDDLKEVFPNAEIKILTLDENDKGKYSDIEIKKPIFGKIISFYKNSILLYARLLFELFLLTIFIFFNKKLRFIVKIFPRRFFSVNEYDLVVACGGGYLLTKSHRSLLLLLVFLEEIILSYSWKKKYIFYNQSIGPFYSPSHLKVLSILFKNAKQVLIREEISFQRISNLKLSNASLVTDIAFNLNSIKDYSTEGIINKNKNVKIGITVRNWLKPEAQKKYENSITEFICFIEKDMKIDFYFMPQVVSNSLNDNDIIVAERILESIKKMNSNVNVAIIKKNLAPGQLKHLISKMDYFIGTRMHSNIFALSSNVKTIAISYEPKTIGIMKMLGLEDYVIEMNEINADILYDTFLKLKLDKNYIEVLKIKIPETQKKGRNNIIV